MSGKPTTRRGEGISIWQEAGAFISEGWRYSLPLARWWIRRYALSYLSTALVSPLIGLFIFLSFSDAISGNDFPRSGFVVDILFLMLLGNLALNWTSSGYFFVGRDSFQKGLSFLRGLPISVRHLVTMRLFVMVFTLAVMTPLMFLPVYLLYVPVREAFGAAGYLWFAVVWACYGFVSGCANAYLDLGFRSRTMFSVQLVWVLFLLTAIVVANLVTAEGIVVGSARLVFSYGPLPAALALVVALGVVCLWFKLLERRLKRKDLTI